MYDMLLKVTEDTRIWEGQRRATHAFHLSPSVYRITPAQQQELTQLGYAITDCLKGLSHLATIAYDGELNYRGPLADLRRIFSSGVPKIYHDLQGQNRTHLPQLLKVDLMVDTEGEFRIAEIDGHNKHGLGYATLCRLFRQSLYPEAKVLPGAVKLLADYARKLGFGTVKIFYADQERFYLPEFQIVSAELARLGFRCPIFSEMEAEESYLKEGLFLDLPFLYHRPELYETILDSYRKGKVVFVIPPKPFLGAKGVLAVLRNDTCDVLLEGLLQSFIRPHSLKLVRRYMPETLLVGKQATRAEVIKERVATKRYVLKESISSGMKGTVFSDDPSFTGIMQTACETQMNWILQEEVVNQPQTFSWFEDGGNSAPLLQTADDWFMRVTVQYVERQLADIIVTARRDKAVHGAKDCIQLGAVIV